MEKSFNEKLLKNASKENKKIKIEQGQPNTSFVLGDDAVKSYLTKIEKHNHKKNL